MAARNETELHEKHSSQAKAGYDSMAPDTHFVHVPSVSPEINRLLLSFETPCAERGIRESPPERTRPDREADGSLLKLKPSYYLDRRSGHRNCFFFSFTVSLLKRIHITNEILYVSVNQLG